MTYTEAQRMFTETRKRKLAGHTYLERVGAVGYGIRYYATLIIVFWPDRTVLDTNGWRTMTTKNRLNEFSRCPNIIQRDGEWYIAGQIFEDGMAFENGLMLEQESTE